MKKILITTILLTVGMAIFLVFDKGDISSATFPELSLEKSGALMSAGFEKVKEKTADLVSNIEGFFSKKSEEAQQKTTESVKDYVGEKLKEIGNNLSNSEAVAGSDSAGGKIGSGKNSNIIENQQFVFLAARIGELAYFTIKNSDLENQVSYSIDWQDSKKDAGKLEKGKSILVSHKWGKAGDYVIDFKIIGLNSDTNYKIQLSIF